MFSYFTVLYSSEFTIWDQAYENRPSEHKKSPIFCLCFIITYSNYLYYRNKILITTAEFNGFSSTAYGNRTLHSERKLLVKIWLDVICTHMVDYCRLGHICDWIWENPASTHSYKYLEIPNSIIWSIITQERKQMLKWI